MKESFGRTQGFWLTVVLPLLFFLTLVPDLGKMAKFSIMAQISNLLAFMVVFWFDFEHLHLFEAMATRREFNVEGLASFFSVAIYCYEVSFRVCGTGAWGTRCNSSAPLPPVLCLDVSPAKNWGCLPP